MNSLLCHVRQQINDLQTAMVGGVAALPRPLLPVVHSVQEELVPVSWIHPNGQPCTHSLTSWLDGRSPVLNGHTPVASTAPTPSPPTPSPPGWTVGHLSWSHPVARLCRWVVARSPVSVAPC